MKHAVITGATSGLGLYLMKALNAEGYAISIICRNKKKTMRILEQHNLKNIDFYIADLTQLQMVSSVAKELLIKGVSIDLLINNAGCLTTGRKVSNEGWEYSMCINYLAPFVLNNSLMPLLKLSTQPIIVNVNSSGHSGQSIDIKNLNEYHGYQAYAVSKLANALFTIELASKSPPSFINIAFDPGPMSSGFGGNLPFGFKHLMMIIKPILPSSKKVAKDFIKTLSTEIKNGGYYTREGLSNYSISPEELHKKTELWDYTYQLTSKYIISV